MSKKPTKAQVAYSPPNPDESRKSCSNCHLWVTTKSCLIHKKDIYIPANAICVYHLFGKPKDEWIDLKVEPISAELSGLSVVPDGTSCDTCKAFDDGKSKCKALDSDNDHVKPKGCCGMWTPKEKDKEIYELAAKGNHPVERRLTFQGMKIAIETDKGQLRHWHNTETGQSGTTKMHYPYGYFEGTKKSDQAGDGMALDVYVGPEEDADEVYIVHQMKHPNFKVEDELKVMLGFESLKQAKAAYLMHYDDERFLGDVDTLSVDAFKDKYITPYVSKALAGKDVGLVAAAGTAGQQPNPNDKGAEAQPSMPPPVRMPGMPMMGPGQMMPMMMGPPPIDVETIDGVNALLGRIGSMKDTELLNVAKEIWGPGLEYVQATPEHVRCEILGFLMDQRDLLGIAPETPLSVSPSPISSTTSTTMPTSLEGPSPSGNLENSAPITGSTDSLKQDISQNSEDPFSHIGSQTKPNNSSTGNKNDSD